jgi:hypothetical protein
MELVFLQDVQGGYASNWARIANTTGVNDIHIGDRFREQGFGPGAEELEVAGVDISPIGGASRLFFNRAANATQPEVHRLGAVFLQVSIQPAAVDPAYQPLRETINTTDAVTFSGPAQPALAGSFGLLDPRQPGNGEEPAKRGRGRPAGSKNKAKEEVAFPAGF